MAVQTNAKVTVDDGTIVTSNLGFTTEAATGATDVEIPQHVANQFAERGVATVTTAADKT